MSKTAIVYSINKDLMRILFLCCHIDDIRQFDRIPLNSIYLISEKIGMDGFRNGIVCLTFNKMKRTQRWPTTMSENVPEIKMSMFQTCFLINNGKIPKYAEIECHLECRGLVLYVTGFFLDGWRRNKWWENGKRKMRAFCVRIKFKCENIKQNKI